MKKIIILTQVFYLLFLSHTLIYASDSLNIKGLTIGDSWDTATRKLECGSLSPQNIVNDADIVIRYWANCEGLDIRFSRNKKINMIQRTIKFDIEPNFVQIKEQIYSEYGQPDLVVKSSNGYKNPNIGYYTDMCWGGCRETTNDPKHWTGGEIREDGSKSLIIHYMSFSNYQGKGRYELLFTLEESNLADASYHEAKLAYEEYLKKLKEKQSKIDF